MDMPSQPEHPARRPRFNRRSLTIAGTSLVFIFFVVGFFSIHSFLSVTHRIPAKVMVIEGWLPDYALESALEEFKRDGYERMFTTGGPLDRGSHLREYGTFAGVAAATLLKLGAPADSLTAVPSSERYRNRTYASAVALRDHLRQMGLTNTAFNLFTEGTHARRSWLCFRRAFGPETTVGVIAIENRDYDSSAWWRYSAGVKTILSETLGFTYAWLSIDYGN